MARQLLSRESLRRGTSVNVPLTIGIHHSQQYYCYAAATPASDTENNGKEKKKVDKWLALPPFTRDASMSETTAFKWILKCCPSLPRNLVQKLFRLRQVRKGFSDFGVEEHWPRRVGAKELIGVGDRILLPKSVDGKSVAKKSDNQQFFCRKESEFISSLELYKDPAIIAVNKPCGMPVQGGLGIKRSLDDLAAKYLRYDYDEPPRLVHRLDRDSSGILVMGRTQLSATILHSIFREKTLGASADVPGSKRILQKRYWALVIGSPRRQEGLISVPLVKVVVDNGKSDRITVAENVHSSATQHAVTEYRVIGSSSHGYTWLELSPLTGRKHQLRVHCAEVLGTPIVGDYKYGRQAHKNTGLNFRPDENNLEKGNFLSDKQLCLHLHCKEMILPDISSEMEKGRTISELNIDGLESSITLDAPLPPHMQRSWNLLMV